MTTLLDQTVEALREELQQSGGLLAALAAQDSAIATHGTDAGLTSLPGVNRQAAFLATARAERESRQRQLAGFLEQDEGTAFPELLPLLPDNYRPLVGALVQENRQLLRRIRESAARNHRLLRHALDGMQHFIDTISSPETSALLGEEPASFAAEFDGSSHRAAV